tara:strand:- start:11326 stop:11577 length:252 start_codon:yes stop_codon:yes gene_type:complete
MDNQRKGFTVLKACLRGTLAGARAIVGLISLFVMGLIDLLTGAAITREDDTGSEDGYLSGDYNFRIRKFDNGTDPYGWYEEDM